MLQVQGRDPEAGKMKAKGEEGETVKGQRSEAETVRKHH